MALVFCSVPCWDSHLATLRHREAWAVEAHAPRNAGEAAEAAASAPGPATEPAPMHVPVEPPARRVVVPPPAPASLVQVGEDDVLIVVSRMKKYIRERSQLSTSDGVADALSVHVRALCDEAIRAAVEAGRKTVLDRDVPRIGARPTGQRRLARSSRFSSATSRRRASTSRLCVCTAATSMLV